MAKIFIVEDDDILRKAIVEILTQEGFEIDVAVNGGEALEKIKAFEPDLIMLDLLLPEKPGEKVLEDIRNDEKTKDIPVMVITVKASQESVDICRGLGISGYIIKPHFTLPEITDEVRKALKK